MKRRLLIMLAIIGPGLITAFADNDAAGVATYSVSAARFGYSMLTVLIPITIVLAITQEIGARIAIVSEHGLGDLIRERFGIRVSVAIFFLLALVNFAVIVEDVSGIKSALELFGLSVAVLLPLAAIALVFFIIRASYKNIERLFLVLILFYITYLISAVLARPDWMLATTSLIVPRGPYSFGYLFTSIAVLGTTVTAWGQFFINSYIKDKKISPDRLKYSQWEIYIGAVLTDLFSFFMMVAVAATIFTRGKIITDAASAAAAIQPLAGPFAGVLFGLGLLIAGFLGATIVPLATAYAFSEFFGYSGSLDETFVKSKLFYILFTAQIGLALLVVLSPAVKLFDITILANFVNGLILPVIFYFLYKFANNEGIMGAYKNTRLQNVLLVGAGVVISVASVLGLIGQVFHW